MKVFLFGIAVAGIGGAAAFSSGGHDYSRVINRPPGEVYAAFASAVQEGNYVGGDNAHLRRGVAVKVDKKSGRSIDVEVTMAGKPVMNVALSFESAEGGKATTVVGDFDVDQKQLAADPELSDANFEMLPDKIFDLAFADMLEKAALRVDAHQSLEPFDFTRTGSEQGAAAAGPSRYEREMAQRQAAAPSASAAPMVDPNKAARNYLHPEPATPGQ